MAEATAGLAKLGADDLTCHPHVIEDLYTTIEDSVCSSVFQCARFESTTKPHAREALNAVSAQKVLTPTTAAWNDPDHTKVIFKPYDEKVVIDGKLNAGDLFWNVWGERDGWHFSGNKKRIPGGCTVRYEGHGDIEWATTNGLCTTLLTMAQQDNFLQYTSFKRRECVDFCDWPTNPPRCCQWSEVTNWQTHIPSRVAFQVINVPREGSNRNPSDQGDMTYVIECPARVKVGCLFCTILKDLFMGGGQIGGIGGATDAVKAMAKGFGLANLLTTVSCQAAGC